MSTLLRLAFVELKLFGREPLTVVFTLALPVLILFVMGGVYDSMIDGARLLRTTLDEYSAPVTYLEVSEGHNTNTFRGHLGDALKALLPQ